MKKSFIGGGIVGALSILLPLGGDAAGSEAQPPGTPREITGEADLRFWWENMVVHHRFSEEEVRQATGLRPEEIQAARKRFEGLSTLLDPSGDRDELLVLPYPGGRHPRIGFLEGAIDPQRETKVSVFLPWEAAGYVVADIPEAIWWNPPGGLGETPAPRELLYLAHTHVPTHWTKRGRTLVPREWVRQEDGSLESERELPNGIRFGTRVSVVGNHVEMKQWLTNGTSETLTGLRVQNCVMLKGAPGFNQLTVENKVFRSPYSACRDSEKSRWVITAWDPCERTWGNERCPCLHSDPRFPDCPPGETVRLRGWLSFYQGTELEKEFERIEATGWRKRSE